MDTRKLRYLIAIAEEGSLSAASQRLGVAQPSLSQHVLNLEQDLGVTLMTRSPRGITMTQAGQLLVEHARDICRRLDECQSLVQAVEREPAGTVAVGLPPSISMVLAVPLAETIRVELPKIKLQAIEGMSSFIKNWLENDTVEIGFVYDVQNLRRMRVHHLLDEHLALFAAPDNWPLASPPGAPVDLADLQALEIILPSQRHGLRTMVDRLARQHDVALNTVMELDAMAQIKELVARGSGYTILSPSACNDLTSRGELVKAMIVLPTVTRPIYLVRRGNRSLSAACQEVERLAIAVKQDLVARGIWEGTLATDDLR